MFDGVLNMHLDYLSCFVVILRGFHETFIYAKQQIIVLLYTEVQHSVIHSHTWRYSIQVNGRFTRLKKNDQLFNLIFFHFLHSNVSDNKIHKKK